ncbi:protein adenylyltransferase SelO [Variovorax sp. VNK109]|uniref:protein adenylyltransferase SelO n=1 Tax=Variovorax sp. VNK109 TaxID=3400919 RepID=UPI003C0E3499
MNANTSAAVAADSGLHWQEGFSRLGDAFFTRLSPRPLPSPYWVGTSRAMARELGLSDEWVASQEALEAFTGNIPLAGSDPLASVYSGHQFGVWAGQLGDGRAILLGETDKGQEIQLKGAGLTPYSRMGDGRAVLRSSIREFLCSEAMHALGVPTSRALCVTGSNAPVRRETMETAAVVTRVAPSFVRFGHFEHFAYSGQHDELRKLADYVIDRYYPECRNATTLAGNPYANLLQAVSARTARLMAHWQAVGFCHGVMNTDNMSILGLTIDYGPFQFLDGFNPAHICNHSDTQGRYAYNRQPNIAYWNLFCLGQALLPLISPAAESGNGEQEFDQELALAALEPYKTQFPEALENAMRAKLGLVDSRPEDRELIESALKLLASEQADYTIFWRRLSHHIAGTPDRAAAEPVRDILLDRPTLDDWLQRFDVRVGADRAETGRRMLAANPKFVLRNHLGEEVIQAAKLGDFSPLQALADVLSAPFDEHPAHESWAGFPPEWASTIEISCSS